MKLVFCSILTVEKLKIPVLILNFVKDLSEGMSQAGVSVEEVMKQITRVKNDEQLDCMVFIQEL